MDYVGIGQERYREVQTCSAGMKQKIKVAQALLHEPEPLILDEPLSFTDPIGRMQITNFIKDYAKSGRSIMIATHILHEVEALTDNFEAVFKYLLKES